MNPKFPWFIPLVTAGVWSATACSSSDGGTEHDGGLGTSGSGALGVDNSGGKASGGLGTAGSSAGGNGAGGKGSVGTASGGRGAATGGNGQGGGTSGGVTVAEAGTDGGCAAPDYLVYRLPGCGGTVKPECVTPPASGGDAGVAEACACDGTSVLGGDGFVKPFRHLGECTNGSVDSGDDAH
jgi:hypothetical protein